MFVISFLLPPFGLLSVVADAESAMNQVSYLVLQISMSSHRLDCIPVRKPETWHRGAKPSYRYDSVVKIMDLTHSSTD